MKLSIRSLALLGAIFAPSGASAQISFDSPFTDHAVLQRGRAIPVHGTGPAGATITVTLGKGRASSVVERNGTWRASLPAQAAGGPYRLEARLGSAVAALDDVMIGDVWLCSGQSNMEFTLRHATNADAEVAQSAHPMLRLFNVPRQSSADPSARLAAPTPWQRSAPASAADFSAACWIMGRDLQQHQDIAIGLIAASWGGSVIEDWISGDALGRVARYRGDLALLAQYRTSPDAARAQWQAGLERWFAGFARDPGATRWETVPTLAAWEEWGGGWKGFDGSATYRATIHLEPADMGAARLVLGKIDDIDSTSVNGRTLGFTAGWDVDRAYAVPGDALHVGDNVLEITVVDTGGGGGLWDAAADRGLKVAGGRTVPITGWQVARGVPIAAIGMPPAMPWIGGAGRTTLYNGMIAPLGDFPLLGYAWYQGEANVNDWSGYAELMPLLIADWRQRFGGKAFLMVQLAGYGPLVSAPGDDSWARLRDVQRRVADSDAQVGLASALDVGQVGDIHPTDKQSVGHRLALAARATALAEPIEARGPSPVDVRRGADGIRVRFGHGPLVTVAGDTVLGFELCGTGGACRYTSARVVDADTVLLPADAGASEVRYLWQASPLVNLYNQAGLPASGFALPIR